MRLLSEVLKYSVDTRGQDTIHYPEITRERENRNDHHRSRAFNLRATRPRDALHLQLQVVHVVLRILDHYFYICHITSLLASILRRGFSGRGGGIRTPTRGFGDRWSAVK